MNKQTQLKNVHLRMNIYLKSKINIWQCW